MTVTTALSNRITVTSDFGGIHSAMASMVKLIYRYSCHSHIEFDELIL